MKARIIFLSLFLIGFGGVLWAGSSPQAGPEMGGPTWTSQGPEGGYIYGMAVHPQNASVLIAVTYYSPGQVVKSFDGGRTWQKIASLNEYLLDVVFDPQNANILYVLSTWGILKSTDGGATWRSFRFGNNRYSSSGKLYICAQNPNVIYAPGYAYYDTVNWKSGPVVYKSTNAGETWTAFALDTASNYGYTFCVAGDRSNPDIVYAGGYSYNGVSTSYHLWKSLNGGTNWTNIIGTITSYPQDIVIDPANPSKVYVCNYSGVWRSSNGGQSWLKNNGYASANRLLLDPTNANILYGGYSKGIYVSSDGGISWSYYSNGLTGTCYALLATAGFGSSPSPQNAANLLFYSSNTGIYRSSDGGKNWADSYSGIIAGEAPAVALSRSSPNVVYTEMTGNGFFKSTNSAGSWNRLPDFYRCEAIIRIFVNPNNANNVFILAGG